MAQRKLAPEVLDEILRRRNNGERLVDLAREFGTPLSTLAERIGSRLQPKKGKDRKVSAAQRTQIIVQAEAMQIEKRRIARTYSISRRRVYQIVGPKKKMPRLTADEIETIYRLLDAGHTIQSVARATGRGRVTIWRVSAKRKNRP